MKKFYPILFSSLVCVFFANAMELREESRRDIQVEQTDGEKLLMAVRSNNIDTVGTILNESDSLDAEIINKAFLLAMGETWGGERHVKIIRIFLNNFNIARLINIKRVFDFAERGDFVSVLLAIFKSKYVANLILENQGNKEGINNLFYKAAALKQNRIILFCLGQQSILDLITSETACRAFLSAIRAGHSDVVKTFLKNSPLLSLIDVETGKTAYHYLTKDDYCRNKSVFRLLPHRTWS